MDVLWGFAPERQRVLHVQQFVEPFGGLCEDRVREGGRAAELLGVGFYQRGRAAADDRDRGGAGEGGWGDGLGERAEVFLAVAAEEVADEEDEGGVVGSVGV